MTHMGEASTHAGLLGGLGPVSRGGETKTGSLVDPDSPRNISLVRIAAVLASAIREISWISRLFGGHGLFGRKHGDVTTPATLGGEFHRALHEGEKGVVTAQADVVARVELGAALADDDVAGQHALAAELLHAEALASKSRPLRDEPPDFL